MFGTKKTLPFWRRRRPSVLNLERALSALVQSARHSDVEYAVVTLKAKRQRIAAAKRKFVRPSNLS
ncbi:MAG TPA: hypothetical protein VFB13_15445 [Reyranella sp.]|jgi:hypothetical protein|nr:hypothetical protein [Reyranella sp.]